MKYRCVGVSAGSETATYHENQTINERVQKELPSTLYCMYKPQLRDLIVSQAYEIVRLKDENIRIMFEDVKLRKENIQLLQENLSLQQRITELEQSLLIQGGKISPLQIAS